MYSSLLANAPAPTDGQVTPAVIGIAVIILMQLAQFLFAYRKDARASEGVRKEDMAVLKSELKAEIDELEDRFNRFQEESNSSRSTLSKKVAEVAEAVASMQANQAQQDQRLIRVETMISTLIMNLAK